MMAMYSIFSRKAMAFNLANGDGEVLRLLQILPAQELAVIKTNTDLLERIQEIAEIDVVEMLQILQSDFSLDVKPFSNGEMWLGTDNLDDAVPDWFYTQHIGWYLDAADLLKFGQDFLMGEVRMNIYLRYLEQQAEKVAKEAAASSRGVGQYI